MVYYGTVSGNYTGNADAGEATSYTLANLVDGQNYYYAVTAYDSTRTESGYSNEVSATVPIGAPPPLPAPSPAPTPTPTPTTFTAGETAHFTTDDSGNANLLLAQPTTLTQAGTLQSLSFYVSTVAGKLRLGFYDATGPSGQPGAKKAETAEFAPVAGWNTVAVTTPIALAAGKYYLAYLPSDNGLHFVKGGVGPCYFYSFSYGAMPATFATTGLSATADHWSFYATFTPSGTPPPIPTPTPKPGLVAAYGFDEGSGTAVTDLSGSGNSGVITSATWAATGRFGKALSFNGTNSWVTVQDSPSLDLSKGMTLEAWVLPTATPMPWAAIIMKEQAGEQAYTLTASSDTGQPNSILNVGSSKYYLSAGTSIAISAWTHLAATYDGTAQRIYINGVQVATQAPSGSLVSSSNPLRIGGDSVWGEHFQGLIDEVRIYNRALSPAEVQADMNTPVSAAK
jgi:hypothetical protein